MQSAARGIEWEETVLASTATPQQFGEMLSNGRDRRSAIESGLRTLIDRGYARKVTTRNEKGMILKVFYEAIVTED